MTSGSKAQRQLANADKLWHLQQTALVSGLSWGDQQVLTGYCSDRIFRKEEVIFDAGSPADHLYIVSRGYVRLCVTGPGRQEKTTAILRSGDVFGESFLASRRAHRTRAMAHEESWILALSRDHFLRMAEQCPVLLLNLIRILNRRLQEAQRDIEALSCMSARQRIADTLVRLGRKHGKPLISDQQRVKLTIPLSHQQLAHLTGGNRPHVSTIMSSFRREGLVGYQGRRLLLDTGGLARQARAAG